MRRRRIGILIAGIDRNAGKVPYQGRAVYPVIGTSLLPLLAGGKAGPRGLPAAGKAYGRGYVFSADGRWKAVWIEPATRDEGWPVAAVRHPRRPRRKP